MKKLTIIFALLLTFHLSPSFLFAQVDESDLVKERLIELFNLSTESNYTDAASYCVYRGSDESRNWNDVYNPENEEEMRQVVGICKRIKGYIDESTEHVFVEFETEEESEGVWNIWEVIFTKESGEKNIRYFAFLEINGEYAIGDID
jgi:hypothetical protein